MFAVIETGGKQYKVQEGDSVKVEKLDAESGDDVEFDKVLLVADEEGEIELGEPYLEDKTVSATVKEQDKHDKIRVTKFKRKQRYKRTYGHKQPYTEVEIGKIA